MPGVVTNSRSSPSSLKNPSSRATRTGRSWTAFMMAIWGRGFVVPEGVMGVMGASLPLLCYSLEGTGKKMDALARERLSDRDSMALFARLFSHGLAGEDVLTELAPDGWERSPLAPGEGFSAPAWGTCTLLVHATSPPLNR